MLRNNLVTNIRLVVVVVVVECAVQAFAQVSAEAHPVRLAHAMHRGLLKVWLSRGHTHNSPHKAGSGTVPLWMIPSMVHHGRHGSP